ncbi:MAG TPA: phenylalanine--tRNA ligase beta subunit-related protein [Candidatus Polarisedimenticolaceae bacterium]|nr:phenylalanine--tRNA ligase beta subunit-related protein [Candidatus Polarisedimenticolaceae bacterium]
MTLVLAADVAPLLRLGVVRAEPVAVHPGGPDLLSEMEGLARELAARHAGTPPGEVEGLRPARTLYRAFGVDPTQTRPSSEALFRRAVGGKPLPRVNNAVDVCNLCSLRFLLPIGMYDLGKIDGDVTLRRGGDTESYPGIRKDEVRLHGRPVLCDTAGPFGNPTSDSLRTSVGEDTRSLWMVIFAPAAYSRERMAAHVEDARATLARFTAPEGAAVATEGEVR